MNFFNIFKESGMLHMEKKYDIDINDQLPLHFI